MQGAITIIITTVANHINWISVSVYLSLPYAYDSWKKI